jgi:hypothetical protein
MRIPQSTVSTWLGYRKQESVLQPAPLSLLFFFPFLTPVTNSTTRVIGSIPGCL